MKKYLTVLTLLMLIIGVAYFGVPFEQSRDGQHIKLRISEIMVSNQNAFYALDGGSYDWIELENYGLAPPLNLAGYGLSDDPSKPFKWTFKSTVLDPGERLLVYASGLNKSNKKEIHTNFAIEAGKEAVLLTSPDETSLSELAPESATPSYSYGYHIPTDQYIWFPYPTPGGEENSPPYYIDKSNLKSRPRLPDLSHISGFYQSEFPLKIDHDKDSQVYYTLDGSLPTPESTLYVGPLTVSHKLNPNDYASSTDTSYMINPGQKWGGSQSTKGTKGLVIRAIAYKEGYGVSDIVNATYFTDSNIFNRFDLPVISLVTDPDNFFDYESGIYVSGKVLR